MGDKVLGKINGSKTLYHHQLCCVGYNKKEKYVLNNKRHKFYILLKQYLRVQLVIGLPWKPSLHWHCPFTHTAYLAHFLLLHNSEIQQFLYHYVLYIQNKLMKTNEKISNLGECHTNLMLYRKSFTFKVSAFLV